MATQAPPQPATSQPTASAPQPAMQPRPSAALGAAQTGSAVRMEEAASGTTNLVATSTMRSGNELAATEEYQTLRLSAPLERMPVDLVVSVPVREFRVRNLLGMASGALIETQWGNGEDLPLTSGDVQLAWTEFEVVDSRLAVRVTRLA